MIDENDGQDQAEQHRDAEAVNEPRQHVAALVVGAEPIVFQIAAALEALALDHRLALRFGQHPGRRRGRRRRQVEIVRRVGIADRRPDHEAAFVGDQLLQIRVAIIRGGFKVAAERRFRISEDHRKIRLAGEADKERLVVGDEFREQRDEKQNQEKPQRPITAPVGLEILPAPFVERRQCEPAGRRRDAERAGRLGVRAELARHKRGLAILADCGGVGLDVQLTPPAFRNRCAGRSRYRSGRRSDSR